MLESTPKSPSFSAVQAALDPQPRKTSPPMAPASRLPTSIGPKPRPSRPTRGERCCCAHAYQVDVVDKVQVQALVEAVLADFGRIDVLVDAASVMFIRPLTEINTAEWETTIDLNIKGSLWGVAAVLPVLLKQQSGHIVNLGSVPRSQGLHAWRGGPLRVQIRDPRLHRGTAARKRHQRARARRKAAS